MLKLDKYDIHKFYFIASAFLFSTSLIIGIILDRQGEGPTKEVVLGGLLASLSLFALGMLAWRTGKPSPAKAKRLAHGKANQLLDVIAHSKVGPLLTNAPKGFVVRIAELIEELDIPERRICEDLLDELYNLTPACVLPRNYGETNECILDWHQYDLCIVAAKEDMEFAEKVKGALLKWNKGCRIHLDAAEGKWAGEKEGSIEKVFYAASCKCLALISEDVTKHPLRTEELNRAMHRDQYVSGDACQNYLMPIPLDDKGLEYIRREPFLSNYAKNMEVVREHGYIANKLQTLLKRSMYIGHLADIFIISPVDGKTIPPQKHFAIALSFPSERQVVVKAVVEELEKLIPDEEVFYHPKLETHLAGEDLRTTLQSFYGDQAELAVVFLCAEYVRSQWCMLEWSVILDLRSHQPRKLMPLRFDKAPIPRLPRTLAYVDCESRTPREIAELIVQRLTLNRRQQ